MVKLLEIFLILVIPILTVGLDIVDENYFFKNIFGLSAIEKTIDYRLTTQFGEPHQLTIDRRLAETSAEFERIWKLIKKNTKYPLLDEEPVFISRYAVENAPFSYIPNDNNDGRKQTVLIPESVPLGVVYCPPTAQDVSSCTAKIIGSVGDLRKWLNNEKRWLRIKADMILTITSMAIGFSLYINRSKKKIISQIEIGRNSLKV